MEQKIVALLARKSSYNNNDQSIQRKFYSLMEICLIWILLIGFLIWKSILIFGRFVMKKKCGLHLMNWTIKQRNCEKTIKSIESDEVSFQSTLGKEWKEY